MNKRLQINCAKGIAIICIVASHILYTVAFTPVWFAPLFGFGVSMYFYCAGYEYIVYKGSIGKEFKAKVLKLFIYGLLFFLIICVFQTIILLILGEADIMSCLRSILRVFVKEPAVQFFPEGTFTVSDYMNIFCAYWFVLFFCTCMLVFIPIARLIHKNKYAGITVFAALIIISILLYCLPGDLPLHFQMVPTFISIMIIGYIIKEFNIDKKVDNLKISWQIIINLIIFIIGELLASQLGLHKVAWGRFAENDASFTCWLMGMCAVVLCSFSFINLSIVFTKIKGVSVVLSWAGINALDIFLVHMFFATEFSKITGIPFGRMYENPADVTPELFAGFCIVFVVTCICSYLFVVLKQYILRKRAIKKLKNNQI